MGARYARLCDVLPLEIARKLSGAEAVANVLVIRSLSPAQKVVVKAVFAESLREMWILYGCVAATGLVISGFIRRQSLNAEHVDTKTGITAVSESSPVPAELETARGKERSELSMHNVDIYIGNACLPLLEIELANSFAYSLFRNTRSSCPAFRMTMSIVSLMILLPFSPGANSIS
jgi:hypothetical protein